MDKYTYFIPLLLWCTLVTGLLHLQYSSEQQRVTDCVITLLQQLNKNCMTIIDTEEILDKVALHALHASGIVLQSILWTNSLLYTDIYVVAVRTYEQLAKGFDLIRFSYYWNPKAHFVIFLEQLENGSKNISRLLLDYNILNVVVVTKNKQDHDIYTFRKNFKACNRSEVLVVANKCHMLDGKNMFPVLKNQTVRGCQFKIIINNKWPLVHMQKPYGVESYIVALFEEHTGVKFHIMLYDYDVRYPFPDIPEGLRNNSVEMVIGGYIVLPPLISKWSFSYPLYYDGLLIIARHRDYQSCWEAMFGRNITLISVISLTFIVYCFISIRLSLFPKREKDITRDIIIVLGYFLNKMTTRSIRSEPAHLLVFVTLLFFVFLMPYIIQGFLYSVINHPIRPPEVKNEKDIVRDYIILLPNEWNAFNMSGRNCNHIFTCLKEVMNNNREKLCTIVTKEQLLTYGSNLLDEQCNSMLYTLKTPYVPIMRTNYFRRGSLLHEPFTKFVLQMGSMGLLRKASDDFIYSQSFKCKPKYVPSILPHSMWDVKEAFGILLIGYTISVIIFVIEIGLQNLYVLYARRLKKN